MLLAICTWTSLLAICIFTFLIVDVRIVLHGLVSCLRLCSLASGRRGSHVVLALKTPPDNDVLYARVPSTEVACIVHGDVVCVSREALGQEAACISGDSVSSHGALQLLCPSLSDEDTLFSVT